MRWKRQRGITLVELLVSIGLLGLTASLLSAGLFQMSHVTEKGRAGLQAQATTRSALLWLARDVLTAQGTDLVDGAPPVSAASFRWTDLFGAEQTDHAISYSLVNGELLRTHDGSTNVVGRQITSVVFSRSARLITIGLTAAPANRFNITDQETLTVGLRSDE